MARDQAPPASIHQFPVFLFFFSKFKFKFKFKILILHISISHAYKKIRTSCRTHAIESKSWYDNKIWSSQHSPEAYEKMEAKNYMVDSRRVGRVTTSIWGLMTSLGYASRAIHIESPLMKIRANPLCGNLRAIMACQTRTASQSGLHFIYI